jgi:hypothetical protein
VHSLGRDDRCCDRARRLASAACIYFLSPSIPYATAVPLRIAITSFIQIERIKVRCAEQRRKSLRNHIEMF